VSPLRALVISKADYCSSVLAGSPAVLLNRLHAVRVECRCQAGFLSKEIRPRYVTSLRATLAQSTRVDEVPTVCADASLHARHGAMLPHAVLHGIIFGPQTHQN